MAHKEKPKKEKIGQEEIVTFSQCGEKRDEAKFTPKKCLPRKDGKRWD